MDSPTSGLIDLVFLLFKGFFRKVFEKGRYIILDNVPTGAYAPWSARGNSRRVAIKRKGHLHGQCPCRWPYLFLSILELFLHQVCFN